MGHPARAYQAYAVAGDVVGVYDSVQGIRQGDFSAMNLLGFAPTIGWAMGAARGLRETGRQFTSLLDAIAEQHVLKGDRWGKGGHYWFGGVLSFLHGITGKKSMFPITWSKQRILHEISDIASDSSVMKLRNPKVTKMGGVPEHFGSRVVDDVDVAAFVRDGRIHSGYPLDSRYYALMKPVHQNWDRLPLWGQVTIGTGVGVSVAAGGYYLFSEGE